MAQQTATTTAPATTQHAATTTVVQTLKAESQGCCGDLRVHAEFAKGTPDVSRYLSGTRVELIGDDKNNSDVVEFRVLHNRNEVYFNRLVPGAYNVRIVTPPGVVLDTAAFTDGSQSGKERPVTITNHRSFQVTVVAPFTGTIVADLSLQKAELDCFAYVDLDCACEKASDCGCDKSPDCESDEPNQRQQPIDGVSITLRGHDNTEYCSLTKNGGKLSFTDVVPGLYSIFPSPTAKGTGDGCTYRLAHNGPLFVQLSPGQRCCKLPVRYCRDEAAIYVSAGIDGRTGCETATGCVADFMLFRDGDPQFFRHSSCHPDESAAFSGLSAGTYIVVAPNPCLSVGGESYELHSPRNGAIRIRVCAGQHIDLSHQFRFVHAPETRRATEISGRITDDAGQAVAHQIVELLQAKTDYVLWTSATDGDGLYRVPWHQWYQSTEVELRVGKTKVRVPHRAPALATTSDAVVTTNDALAVTSDPVLLASV